MDEQYCQSCDRILGTIAFSYTINGVKAVLMCQPCAARGHLWAAKQAFNEEQEQIEKAQAQEINAGYAEIRKRNAGPEEK